MSEKSARFIKSYAGYIGSPIWSDDSIFKLFHYCLYKASHNRYSWRGMTIDPGELPISLRHTAEELNWSKSKTQQKLQILQEIGYISVFSSTKGSILRINDWDSSQGSYVPSSVTAPASFTDDMWAENQPTGVPEISPRNIACTENQPTSVPEIIPLNAACAENQPMGGPEISPRDAACTENQPTGGLKISPYQYSKDNKDTLYCNRPPCPEPEGFSTLWLAYPVDRRTYRDAAANLYREALTNGATPQSIMAALEAEKMSATWVKESGRFIPGIVKWLQKESWRDYLTQAIPEEDEEWITR